MSTKREPNRLRVLRAERRMTQMELSERARIHVTQLSFIENGVRPARDVERRRLARALKLSIADIFPQQESVAS